MSSTHRVTGVQKNREPLENLQRFFGGRIHRRSNGVDSRINEWYVTGARARGVMMTLYSLMSKQRKLQIRKALGEGVGDERGDKDKQAATNEAGRKISTESVH